MNTMLTNGVKAHLTSASGIGFDSNIYENAMVFENYGRTDEDMCDAILEYLTRRVKCVVEHYLSDWDIDIVVARKRIEAGLPFVVMARPCGTQITWIDGRNSDSGRLLWWNYYSNEAEFSSMVYLTVDPARCLVFEGKKAAENYICNNEADFEVLSEQAMLISRGSVKLSLIYNEDGFNSDSDNQYLVCRDLDTVAMTYTPLMAFSDRKFADKYLAYLCNCREVVA